jgi:hypothetical protein
VFIDFGYHKFTKLLNAFLVLVNCSTLLLTVHFVIMNFDHSCVSTINIYRLRHR